MKKSYLMIAAAVALLTACEENEVRVERAEQNSVEQLSFSAFANKVTKGTNSTALNDFYKEFGVYGWKTTPTGTQLVFSNVANEYFTSDAAGETVYNATGEKPSDEWNFAANSWYYKNVRYWDKMATSYQFFAIAPFEASPIYSVKAGDNNIAIATSAAKYDISTEKNLAMTAASPAVPQTALSYSGFNKDYMIAEKTIVDPKTRTTGTDVQLVFHHILTKLNVKIQKADAYKGKQELKVNKLTIANLAKEGNFVFNTNMTTNGWSTTETYNIDITDAYSLSAETNYSGKYWIETLIFPQTATKKAAGAQATATALTDIYLYIQYQIGDEIFDAYYDFADIWNSSLAVDGTFEFKQGSQYELTLTVGPEPIHFDATVTEWNTETAGSLTVD